MSSTVPVPDSNLTPDEVVQLLRALGPRIPEFVLMPTSEVVSLARAASTDIAQINSAIDAIAASTNLSAALGSDAAVLRSESEVTNRWSQVLVELDSIRRGVEGALRARRHRLGSIALRAYQISRQMVRDNANPELLPHVDAMRRAARNARRRPQPPVESGPPAP